MKEHLPEEQEQEEQNKEENESVVMKELEDSIERIQSQLHEIRTRRSKSRVKLFEKVSRLESLERQFHVRVRQGAKKSIYTQALLTEGVAPYVMNFQALLCQKLHWMGIYHKQINMVSSFSRQELNTSEESIATLQDVSMTFELMNQISSRDEGNFKLRNAYLDVIKAQTNIIRKLDLMVQPRFPSNPDNYLHKLTRFFDEDDDDEDDDDADDNNKEEENEGDEEKKEAELSSFSTNSPTTTVQIFVSSTDEAASMMIGQKLRPPEFNHMPSPVQ